MSLSRLHLAAGALLTLSTLLATPVAATDVDGPDDCGRFLDDWGDAPESFMAYPASAGGAIGNFPTCSLPGGTGTQTTSCPPISTPPGPTGYVKHFLSVPGSFWLGCYAGPMGIDFDPEGKTGLGGSGNSFCNPAITTDCVEPGYAPLSFDQDECLGDGSDAGLFAAPSFVACNPATVAYEAFSCHATAQGFLNILLDMNSDGDWNDNFACPPPAGGCAYEWAVRNHPITLAPGCNPLISPAFLVGPNVGLAWMRISISQEPVGDDFPWNGTAAMPGGQIRNGETEDYPFSIQAATPASESSWGRVKSTYR
jgi:hypothetical protein